MIIPVNSRIATSIRSDFDTAPLSFRWVVLASYVHLPDAGAIQIGTFGFF